MSFLSSLSDQRRPSRNRRDQRALGEEMTAVLPARGWRDRAACRGVDPDAFFPVAAPGTGAYEREAAAALRACRACPVRNPCLDWAVRHSPDHGIWGGTAPSERNGARLSLTREAA